jgi:hypothetical protein
MADSAASLLARARAKRDAARAAGSTKAEDSASFAAGISALGFAEHELISFDKGWRVFARRGMGYLEDILAKGLSSSPEPIDKMLYFAIQQLTYKMACQQASLARQVYDALARSTEDYLRGTVLPALRGMTGEALLRELRARWWNHLFMVHWLNAINTHLNHSFVEQGDYACIMSLLLKPFYEIVWVAHRAAARQAVLGEINKSRNANGAAGDRELVKNIVRIATHMGACSTNRKIIGVTTKSGFKKSTWKDAPLLLDHKDLSVYKADFETDFLTATRAYYEAQAQNWVAQGSAALYLERATAALAHERALLTECLIPESSAALVSVCQDAILRGPERSHLAFILESATGVGYMLNNDKFADLHNMHAVLESIQEQQPMADAVRDHIVSLGEQVIEERVANAVKVQASEKKARDKAAADAKKKNRPPKSREIKEIGIKASPDFICKLVVLYGKYNKVIDGEFNKDPLFQTALEQAFQRIVKIEPGDEDDIDPNLVRVERNAEMLAAHLHKFVFKKVSSFEDGKFEEQLHECASLFRFLVDKDLFLVIYKKLLSQRLLSGKADQSIENEKIFIRDLKKDQGTAYTASLETMMLDIEKCEQVNEGDAEGYNTRHWERQWEVQRKDAVAKRGGGGGRGESKCGNDEEAAAAAAAAATTLARWGQGASFKVKPLTMRCWPAAPNPPYLIVPPCVTAALKRYEAFFKCFEKHSDRHLAWAHMLGKVELKIMAKKGTRTLSMTPLQAFVCLCFQSFDHSMTGEELHRMLSMEDKTAAECELKKATRLKRVMYYLTTKKAMVLTMKDAEGKKLSKMAIEAARFSPNYSFTSAKRKVSVPAPEFPNSKEVARVKEERGDAIDAMIVRLMKTAGRMKARDLVNTVMERIKLFTTSPRAIKKRITKLMDEEYLRRDPDDPSTFEYLA